MLIGLDSNLNFVSELKEKLPSMADIISEKEKYRYILIDSTSASSGLVDGELLSSFFI